MGKLVVTSERILEKANNLRPDVAALYEHFESISQMLEQIDNFFLFGEADTVKKMSRDRFCVFKDDYEMLFKHVGALSDIAKEYKTAERENVNVINTID